MRAIGLTGGIASGKSSVARILEEKGIRVVDADQLARDAVALGSPGLDKIVAAFGSAVLLADGTLDRAALRQIVFADRAKKKQLESILHPEISRLADQHLARARGEGLETVIYMAPLLIEAGVQGKVDEIWVVTVTPEIQVERLMKRDGISHEEAQRIIGSQMPLTEKAGYGRIVIDNSGTPEDTRRSVETLYIKELSGNGQ